MLRCATHTLFHSSSSGMRTHARACAHSRTHARMYARTNARTRTNAHAHTQDLFMAATLRLNNDCACSCWHSCCTSCPRHDHSKSCHCSQERAPSWSSFHLSPNDPHCIVGYSNGTTGLPPSSNDGRGQQASGCTRFLDKFRQGGLSAGLYMDTVCDLVRLLWLRRWRHLR